MIYDPPRLFDKDTLSTETAFIISIKKWPINIYGKSFGFHLITNARMMANGRNMKSRQKINRASNRSGKVKC